MFSQTESARKRLFSVLHRCKAVQFTIICVIMLAVSGCATVETAGKVVVTPVTVVRDVVDAPLATVTNATNGWARASNPRPVPQVGGGWTYKGGFDTGIGINYSYFAFKGITYVFGTVDYLICRSIWPNFPDGINPWKRPDESWGRVFFPNTRSLWNPNYEPVGMGPEPAPDTPFVPSPKAPAPPPE